MAPDGSNVVQLADCQQGVVAGRRMKVLFGQDLQETHRQSEKMIVDIVELAAAGLLRKVSQLRPLLLDLRNEGWVGPTGEKIGLEELVKVGLLAPFEGPFVHDPPDLGFLVLLAQVDRRLEVGARVHDGGRG